MTPATPTDPAPSAAEVKERLNYIANSPSREDGGFHHEAIKTAKMALSLIERGEMERERLGAIEATARHFEYQMQVRIADCDQLRAQLAAATERVKRLHYALSEIGDACANGEPISMLWAKTALQEDAARAPSGERFNH